MYNFVLSPVYYLRHLVTAAHCVCSYAPWDKANFETHCLESSKNQITNDNTIVVSGGSYSTLDFQNSKFKVIQNLFNNSRREKWGKQKETWKLEWGIYAAYIIDDNVSENDIGIAELMPVEMFFDSRKLLLPIYLQNAPIVPICLGALNLNKKVDMSNAEIKGVGWGVSYEEMPDASDTGGTRNPVYSSCMTSQASPDSWRFQNCDMQKMKKLKKSPREYIWTCEKSEPPPEYKNGQNERCQNYFRKFERVINKIDPTISLAEKRLNDIDVMYIDDGKKIKETCYNPKKLLERGWCYLKDYPEKYKRNWKGGVAWGICSNSCDSNLMKVKTLQYNNVTYRNYLQITIKCQL